jgi:hypothetical protein
MGIFKPGWGIMPDERSTQYEKGGIPKKGKKEKEKERQTAQYPKRNLSTKKTEKNPPTL